MEPVANIDVRVIDESHREVLGQASIGTAKIIVVRGNLNCAIHVDRVGGLLGGCLADDGIAFVVKLKELARPK